MVSNHSQKSFFFLSLMQLRYKRKSTIMLRPFLLSHGATSINSWLQVPVGLRDNCTGPEGQLNITDFPGSPLIFTGTKYKQNWRPWEKGPPCAGEYCRWRENGAGRTDHRLHGCMAQARMKYIQGSHGGLWQRLEGFKANSTLFKRTE